MNKGKPNKTIKFLIAVPLLLFFLPFVVLIRILGIWRVVRLGPHISHRIGHYAGNTEVYLCEKDAGFYLPSQKIIDVFYYHYPVCNTFLRKMWDRELMSISLDISLLDKLNRKIPGGKKFAIPMPNYDRDVHGLFAKTLPHLSFTEEEERAGQAGLRAMGIPEGAEFVCFHSRDSAYLKTASPGIDSSYHDFRDSHIGNYISGAEALAGKGLYAVRMGAVVAEALHTGNTRIIDYASTDHRSDFMDVYLGAKCRFFISSGTGIDAIPMIFRRLSAFVNFVPLEYGRFWQPGHVFIPKKYWLKSEKRFMKFGEILNSGVGRFLYAENYLHTGIELIENSPEEIRELAEEMNGRLSGDWITTEEDEDLQRRFWSLFKKSELNSQFLARIGARFLQANRELLD